MVKMPVRLEHGGAYTSGIEKIRAEIRKNGSGVNLIPIVVTHPLATGWVSLVMNYAFQSNTSVPRAPSSLYIVGILNPSGAYIFDGIQPFPGGIANAIAATGALPNALSTNIDPTYAVLGFNNAFTTAITDANLQSAVANISGFNDAANTLINQGTDLALLIITVAEAIRFGAVSEGIDAVLGQSGASFTPSWNAIHSWGGRTIGS
jgi:Ribosome inactivating protein